MGASNASEEKVDHSEERYLYQAKQLKIEERKGIEETEYMTANFCL